MAQNTVSDGYDEGGDDDEEDSEDFKTRLGEAQRMPRHLLDPKGTLPFFSLLFSQPQIYSGIDTALIVLLPPIPNSCFLKPTLFLSSCSTISNRLGCPLLPVPGTCGTRILFESQQPGEHTQSRALEV